MQERLVYIVKLPLKRLQFGAVEGKEFVWPVSILVNKLLNDHSNLFSEGLKLL